jgi:hypothetical protein
MVLRIFISYAEPVCPDLLMICTPAILPARACSKARAGHWAELENETVSDDIEIISLVAMLVAMFACAARDVTEKMLIMNAKNKFFIASQFIRLYYMSTTKITKFL